MFDPFAFEPPSAEFARAVKVSILKSIFIKKEFTIPDIAGHEFQRHDRGQTCRRTAGEKFARTGRPRQDQQTGTPSGALSGQVRGLQLPGGGYQVARTRHRPDGPFGRNGADGADLGFLFREYAQHAG